MSIQLGKPRGALQFLINTTQTGMELRHILLEYPKVRYQPLDFFYACSSILAARNEALINDLMNYYTWRGVVFAAWLIVLSPDTRFIRFLEHAQKTSTDRQWIVELALYETKGAICEQYVQQQELLKRMRFLLESMPSPLQPAVLRMMPSTKELQIATCTVRSAYREGGADLALKAIRESTWGTLL